LKEDLRHDEHRTFVERPEQEFAHAHVRPVPVNQQEPLKESELGKRVVGRPSCLETLPACDTDADVRGLDHPHVVGAIADRKCDLVQVFSV